MGGFVATSNAYFGKITGVPVVGTLAHSFIMSFEDDDVP